MRLAGVVRISHMGGRKAGADNVHADRDQIEAIRRGAQARNATLHMLPPELDISGGLPLEERPSLLKAVQGVENGKYDGIIVAYLSRLGRNVREQLRAWDRVENAGGTIVVVQEGIDTSTPHGRLMRTMLLANAEHEREVHAERFENLRVNATKAGIWQRRQYPIGYKRNEKTRTLVPDERASEVKAAFAARASGASTLEIARMLKMSANGVRGVLRNRVYLGELRVGEHVNPSAHDAIIDEDLWVAAQRPATVRIPKSSPDVALLAGLVRCCGCGHLMPRAKSKVVVYACAREHSAGRCPAPATITARLLDEHVEEIALTELAALVDSPAVDDSGVEKARKALRSAERELEAFLAATSAADIGAEAFGVAARQRQQTIQDARKDLERAISSRTPVLPASVLDDWEAMSAEQRNRLLRSLIETVLVQRAGGRGHVVPVGSRVRVIRHGSGLAPAPYRGAGKPQPLVTIDLPDADDVRVLRP